METFACAASSARTTNWIASGTGKSIRMGFDVAALAVASLFVVKRTDNPTIQPGKEVILPIRLR
jgi:hypothetical protein